MEWFILPISWGIIACFCFWFGKKAGKEEELRYHNYLSYRLHEEKIEGQRLKSKIEELEKAEKDE